MTNENLRSTHPARPIRESKSLLFFLFLLLFMFPVLGEGTQLPPSISPSPSWPANMSPAPKEALPPLRFSLLAGPGVSPALFVLPKGDLGIKTRRDVLDASRASKGRIVVVLRPGNVVIESSDEGATWIVREPNISFNSLVTQKRRWWALGNVSKDGHPTRVIASDDGGKTWRGKTTGRSLEPQPRALVQHQKNLVLGASDYLVWSESSGQKWEYIDPKIKQTITAIQPLSDPAHWWIGGERGRISHGQRGAWSVEEIGEEVEIRGFGQAPSGVLFVATERGLWRRKGGAWVEVQEARQRNLHGVEFFGNTGVAYGAFGRLLISANGGDVWLDYTPTLLKILGLTPLEAHDLDWSAILPSGEGLLLFGSDATILRIGGVGKP